MLPRRFAIKTILWLVLMLIMVPPVVLGGFLIASYWREDSSPTQTNMGRSFIRVDGLDIHYMSWGPADGPAILLVPGTLAWSGTWTTIAPGLAQRGYRVIAADFPPFGYSQRPVDGDYSRAALARRIHAFSEAMGLKTFILAGHSFGGGGTVEAAFSRPDRVAGLVLLDPALRLNDPAPAHPPFMSNRVLGEAIVSATLTNPLVTAIGLRRIVTDPTIITPELASIYQAPLSMNGTTKSTRQWLLKGLFADESTALSANPENYRAFTKPTLLIWGRDDTVTPLSQGQELATLLPTSRLAVLDHVNHVPQIEAPNEVIRLMADFVAAGFASKKPDNQLFHHAAFSKRRAIVLFQPMR